jgi:SSS family transporter
MLSSITFISIPTMTYIGDWRYFPMVLCILGLAPIAIFFYLPFFCRLRITSAYEYLEKRFNVGVRLFGAGVFNIFMICRVAVVTLLPAIALNSVTGMPIWLAILLCGIATIIYCFFGGVEAVIWSDFVQGLILLGGAILVLIYLISASGGVSECFEVANAADKFRTWDFRFLFNQPVFWVVLIMGLVSNLNSYTADQCVVQRYITTPNEASARRSIWFNGVLSVISSVIFYFIGTSLYTYYVKNPGAMDITMPKSDSVFPTFMAIDLHPIFSGLIVAAIFAATISTLSTNLNSSATSIVTDFIARFKKDMSSEAQVKCGSWCVAIVGVFGVVAALILSTLETRSLFDTFQNFISTLTGGLSALFFIGIFMPRVSGMVAIIALIVNYIISLTLPVFVSPDNLHAFTYGGIALVGCIVVAWVGSFIAPNKANTKGLTHFSRPEAQE